MNVSPEWRLAYEFACNAAACAPPPAGRGGSLGGPGGPRAHMHLSDAALKRSGKPEHKRELERRKTENTAVYLAARAIEFACHSKACAPPPAGKGGSDKGDSGHVSHQYDSDAPTDEERRAKRRFEAGYAFETQPGYKAPPRIKGGSLPGTHAGDHLAAYKAMKKRQEHQDKLALVNRARANHGMPPLRG